MAHQEMKSAGAGGEVADLVRQVGYHDATPLQHMVLPHLLSEKNVAVEAPRGAGVTVAVVLAAAIAVRETGTGPRGLILHSSPDGARRIAGVYRGFRRTQRGGPILVLGENEDLVRETALLRRPSHVIAGTPGRVIDHIRRGTLDASNVEYLAVDARAADPGFRQDVDFILAKVPRKCQIAMFARSLRRNELQGNLSGRRCLVIRAQQWCADGGGRGGTSQGSNTMNERKQIDEAALKGKIDEVLRRITLDEDPYYMNDLKRLYKKHVPLYRRAYFSAFLLSQIAPLQPSKPRRPDARPDRTRDREPSGTDGFVKLFVSIGKKRRIYPRDLRDHFVAVLGIDPQDLGQTKVLDNYSFIEIARKHADRAISELTDTELRGRKITVNLARSKEDKSTS